ncbi:MAG: prephenate dehydratase [Chloroflexi bacterium]|nr:prephenate dehydratase [Chloroflexota bacterium]
MEKEQSGQEHGGPAAGPAIDLTTLRAEIDELDEHIAGLLQRRAAVSLQVGRAKGGAGQSVPVYVPDREAVVLQHVRSIAGPLSPDAVVGIYREILSASRSLQRPVRVAHLGPAATFGHEAALAHFGRSTTLVPVTTNSDVFTSVEKGDADYGLVPFENSSEGPVNEVLDRLVDTELRVCAEVTIPVAQTLVSKAGRLADVQRVRSHPQALGQTRGWLAQYLPHAAVEPTSSTGLAAEQAAADPTLAAVAPRIAAEVFDLHVLAENIQDVSGNYTRFLVLGPARVGAPSGRDRTGLVFSIKDRVGALRDLTDAFASYAVNLSSIQSRPSKRRVWDYVFFVELDGHIAEERVRQALKRAEEHTQFLKVLGSWPADES